VEGNSQFNAIVQWLTGTIIEFALSVTVWLRTVFAVQNLYMLSHLAQ